MIDKVLNRPRLTAGAQRPATSRERFAARAASVRRRPRRVLSWGGALVLFAAVSAWVMLGSPLLRVDAVQVQGVSAGAAAAVRERAAVPIGQPLARIDTAAVARRSLAADLASVSVRRSWPHTLVIRVVPRVAVLAVERPDNPQRQVELWDHYGISFATVTRPPAGVPLLATSRGQLSPLAVRSVAGVLQAIPESERRDVSRVNVSAAGLVTFRLKKLSVVWGDASDSALKLQVLSALVPQAHSLVDVSAPRTPAVR